MLARQTGVILVWGEPARRELRWLALRGSPPGSLDRPVNALPRALRNTVLCRETLLCPKIRYKVKDQQENAAAESFGSRSGASCAIASISWRATISSAGWTGHCAS